MIRIARQEDIPQMLEIYRPFVEQTVYSFEYDLPCQRSFTARFLEHTAQFPWLVYEEGEKVLGYAYAGAPWERGAYRWCAEVSIYLAPQARSRGVGRAMYQRLEEILQAQGYARVYAVIVEENRESIAFHQALGYHQVARFAKCGYKMGRWLDTIWMEKELLGAFQPREFPRKWMDVYKF